MNRRTALKAMAAGLASFILPAPRPRIDLSRFCRRDEWGKYDLRLPFEVDDWTYATDAKICVRVRPALADAVQRKGEVPPFHALSWDHDRQRGWRELPKLEPLLASDSDCPHCEGYGTDGAVCRQECPQCEGMGRVWVGSNWHQSYPKQCPRCHGRGDVLPPGVPPCSHCDGNAIGVFPSIVCLYGRFFDAKLYEKARSLGSEFVHGGYALKCEDNPMIRFRFDGGVGLLLGLDRKMVELRLR